MNRCEELREQIHLYVDNELPASDLLEVEKHLVECSACRGDYQKLRAVVDSIRGAKPLYELPEGSLGAARELVAQADRPSRWRRWLPAGAILAILLVGGLAFLWLRRESPLEFAAFAADTHLRYAKGAMPLDIASPEPEIVSQWLGARLPFHLDLPNYPVEAGQQKPYRLAGARLLQYMNEDVGYLAYEMEGKPISLLMASTPQAAPRGGELYRSGSLIFHFSYQIGLKLISWSDGGIHYCIVSTLAARGAESCVICHGAEAERPKIERLTPSQQDAARPGGIVK